jgi:hypothetical protein
VMRDFFGRNYGIWPVHEPPHTFEMVPDYSQIAAVVSRNVGNIQERGPVPHLRPCFRSARISRTYREVTVSP